MPRSHLPSFAFILPYINNNNKTDQNVINIFLFFFSFSLIHIVVADIAIIDIHGFLSTVPSLHLRHHLTFTVTQRQTLEIGFENWYLSKNVALHGEQKTIGICEDVRGGN